ncbi:MAG: hypothetical protein ACPGRX_01290 [Bdellovibrionales bacterium]
MGLAAAGFAVSACAPIQEAHNDRNIDIPSNQPTHTYPKNDIDAAREQQKLQEITSFIGVLARDACNTEDPELANKAKDSLLSTIQLAKETATPAEQQAVMEGMAENGATLYTLGVGLGPFTMEHSKIGCTGPEHTMQ